MVISWSLMNRLRKPAAERNYRTMLKAYKQIGRDFLNRIEKYGMAVIYDHDMKLVDTKPIEEAYIKIVGDTIIQFAKYGRKAFKTRKAEEDIYNQWFRDIDEITRKVTGQFIKTIQSTTTDEIIRLVGGYTQRGIEDGLGIPEIGKILMDEFAGDWGESSKWMSRRVAQTETIRASNYGTRMGVDSLGIDYLQSWLAATDERTRETHLQAAIDNNRIPKDQKFRVGGYECDYPGDSALPPEESINCRCSWTAEPID